MQSRKKANGKARRAAKATAKANAAANHNEPLGSGGPLQLQMNDAIALPLAK